MKKFLLAFLLALPAFSAQVRITPFCILGKPVKIKGLKPGDLVRIDAKQEKIPHGWGFHRVEVIRDGKVLKEAEVLALPGIFTLLPPAIAILLALLTKDVFTSLLLGIFTSSLLLNLLRPLEAFLRSIDTYIIRALLSSDKLSIVLFTLLLGAMVGVMSKSGGIEGIVQALARKVRSGKTTQLYTWLLGIFIFFDDYTNTLIVGNTMRPLADRWKVSREKLAYIVDSTAAPVASVALISTWIGFEVSLIGEGFRHIGLKMDPYMVFLRTLPIRFYVIFALFFGFLIIVTGREFGPMLKAEQRAKEGKVLRDGAIPLAEFEIGPLLPPAHIPKRWINGVLPVLAVIVVTFSGIYITGINSAGNLPPGPFLKKIGLIFSSGDSFRSLLWGSFLGFTLAVLMAVAQRLLKLREAVKAGVDGMKAMLTAVIILSLAWALSESLMDLQTGDYLASALSGKMDPRLLPAAVFLTSALISFSTGTSWGTMSIVYPLVIPLTYSLAKGNPHFERILIAVVGSVLSGAVFGDHCSPISDTTIMSSMASSCDHVDHVRTQIPYALTVAIFSLLFGVIPYSFSLPYPFTIALEALALTLFLLAVGKSPLPNKK